MVRRAAWRRRWQRALAKQGQRQGSVTLEVQVATQGCATSRCLETRHCAEPRRWTFAAQPRRSMVRCSVRQGPRRMPQPRAGSVPPEHDPWVGGFERVCGSTSFWSTGVCSMIRGCRSLRQMERQLGQRCPPSLLEGRRQAQSVLGSHSVQGRGYWNGHDSDVLLCPFGSSGAGESRGEERGGEFGAPNLHFASKKSPSFLYFLSSVFCLLCFAFFKCIFVLFCFLVFFLNPHGCRSLSFVFCLLSFVFCLLSFVFCLLSFVFCLLSFVFFADLNAEGLKCADSERSTHHECGCRKSTRPPHELCLNKRLTTSTDRL